MPDEMSRKKEHEENEELLRVVNAKRISTHERHEVPEIPTEAS